MGDSRNPTGEQDVSVALVYEAWWPLAASWLLMALEMPAVSAVVARLADPSIHLAAFGVVFHLSILVEAPIIMLLAASTALSRDWESYRKLRAFMIWSASILTLVHILITVTPLFDLIVGKIMNAPEEIHGPARIGLLIMIPWTAAIAFRRFQQGVLIRFGHSRLVGIGTAVRLLANFLMLTGGYLVGGIPGIVVGASAVAFGVVAEAVFIGVTVKSDLRTLRSFEHRGEPLTLGRLLHFYFPLAITSVMTLSMLPLLSAGMGRMPRTIDSLATWPVLNGILFGFKAAGLAYNEVVVAMLDRSRAVRALFRFNLLLAGGGSVFLLLIAGTDLGWIWFAHIIGLPPALAHMAVTGLWIGSLVPVLSVFQNWYQGILVHSRHTRGISEAVALSLFGVFLALGIGIRIGVYPGLFVAVTAMAVGSVMQVFWLWYRSRPEIRKLRLSPTGSTPEESR